jgi:SAM-dependent methyltransferase
MKDLDAQAEYWDSVAVYAASTHPIPLSVFRDFIPSTATILDYGCGYGRICSELAASGYRKVVGIDISKEMIKRGRSLNGALDLRLFDGRSPGFDDGSFDVCLLIAVLHCIPSDAGQEHAIDEVRRLLKPGGIVFVSDYPLQTDARYRKLYRESERELGIFGVFRSGESVIRHHDMRRIHKLLSGFNLLWQDNIRICNMYNKAHDVFRILARKEEYG